MAREKVGDKEKAIVEAAIEVFAERGFWNTPTSMISKTAGVADGTLFTYFATKDDLIHAVYLTLKREVAEALMTEFDSQPTFKDKMRHIWSRYIQWGVAYFKRFKVMEQIKTSYTIAPEVVAEGLGPFIELDRLGRESIEEGLIRDYPMEYLTALLDSQTAMTIHFINDHPEVDRDYIIDIGFDILWKGTTS